MPEPAQALCRGRVYASGRASPRLLAELDAGTARGRDGETHKALPLTLFGVYITRLSGTARSRILGSSRKQKEGSDAGAGCRHLLQRYWERARPRSRRGRGGRANWGGRQAAARRGVGVRADDFSEPVLGSA